MNKFTTKFALLSPLLLLALVCFGPSKVHAVTAADWKAGRIIDDSVFTNSTSMTPQEVQNFLNARVPVCDTNGTQATGRWNASAGRYYTRAEWGALNGNPAPFTCLKDFWEVPKTDPTPGQPANNYGGAPVPAGAKSAAQIIWDAAQRYQISPKVLLTTIQKESYGPLTSDDWPYRSQYQYPMGAHCPDTAPCDPAYEGFSIQIYESARLFRYYINNMNQSWWPYKKPNQNNSILYNPNAACGSSNVYIESYATAALYTYTPYQPNAAALANMNGTGDSCSAYGNRNFWRIFNDWFGSSTSINGSVILSKGLAVDKSNGFVVNDNITASFEVANTALTDAYVGGVGVCARMNGQYYDFGFIDQLYLPPSVKKQVSFSKKLDSAGTLYLFICSYHPVLGWASDRYPYNSTGSTIRSITQPVVENPTVTSGLGLLPTNPSINQPLTASLSITNNSNSPINIGSLLIAARDGQGNNVDFPITNDVIIPANTTFPYSVSRTFTSPGNYTFFIASWNGYWRTDYPKVANGASKNLKVSLRDNPLVISGITINKGLPISVNSPVTAQLSIYNASSSPINIGSLLIAARDGQGNNVDFPITNDVIIPANTTFPYSVSRTFTSPGNYTFFIASWNGYWRTDYPKVDISGMSKLSLSIN